MKHRWGSISYDASGIKHPNSCCVRRDTHIMRVCVTHHRSGPCTFVRLWCADYGISVISIPIKFLQNRRSVLWDGLSAAARSSAPPAAS